MITKAKQIWLQTEEWNQYAEILHTFSLSQPEKNAIFEIYCETEYAVWINGAFVGSGQYKSFENKRVYDSYEVSNLLQSGENEIFIIANHQGFNTSTYVCGKAGVVFALSGSDTVYACSGSESLIRKSTAYRSGKDVELTSWQLGYTYHYDAMAQPLPWQKASIVASDLPLEERPIAKMEYRSVVCGTIRTQGVLKRETNLTAAENMQRDFLSHREESDIFDGMCVKKNPDGVYFVLDLGNEYAGLFTMTLCAGAETEIDIGYGEHLDDLRVRSYVTRRYFASHYRCTDGRQSFTGYFRRFAGRYLSVHITNMTDDVVFSEIGLIPTEYPLSHQERFRCNDYFYNKLYEVSLRTLKLCMHEHYEDCPWREQALYAFDSYVQMRCGYYAYGEYQFARASLALLADGQRSDGLLEICAPSRVNLTIPSFSLAWILSLEQYVLFSGDVEFGVSMLPVADGILQAFSVKNDAIVKEYSKEIWHFYEWSDGGLNGDRGIVKDDSVIYFYYILACESYNKICEYAGKTKKYETAAIKQKVSEMFYDEASGLFRTFADSDVYHELTQALAILSGVGDWNALAPRLADEDNGLVKATLSTSMYKYDALLKEGNQYLEFVTDDIAKTWGDMLYSGADTLWETSVGASDFDDAGSLCHAWSAVPVYILYRYHLGFYPTAPGFRTYELNPCATKAISRAEAHLYMPSGILRIKVKDGTVAEQEDV